MKKYRIVTDDFAGYEVQSWRWYWPFWLQCDMVNTHCTVDEAMEYIESLKNPFKPTVVKDGL